MDVDTSNSDTTSATSLDARWHRAAPIITGESRRKTHHNVRRQTWTTFQLIGKTHSSLSTWTENHICTVCVCNSLSWDAQ